MKKHIKYIIAVLLVISAYLLYTYALFDDEPFDNLTAGEISSARFILDGGHISITNLGELPDILDDIELERRAYRINPDLQKGQVTLELAFNDGNTTIFTIDNKYITTEKDTFSADTEENAKFLKWAFKQNLFDAETIEKGNQYKIDEMVDMAIDGKNWEEIRDWSKTELFKAGFSDDMLRSFANQGYSPIYIYALSDLNRNQLITQTLEFRCNTQNKLLVDNIWQDYKNGNYSDTLPPEDFAFGDTPDWGSIELGHNGYYTYATIPSADNKYNMLIYFDAAEFTLALNEVDYKRPNFRFVSFEYGSGAGIPADYPAVNVIKSGNALATADILTEKLTVCLNSSPETPSFAKVMFICMLNHIENKNFCYYNIFPLMPDRNNYQFKTTNMEKVIRQVLGDYSWDAKRDFFKDADFNEKSQSYEFSTDFGWGLNYSYAQNITSSFSADGKQVYSECDIKYHDDASDSPNEHLGRYRAVYDIVTEGGETFLRFNRYQKI